MGFSGFWIAASALTAVQKVKIAENRQLCLIIVQRRRHFLIIERDNFLLLFLLRLNSSFTQVDLVGSAVKTTQKQENRRLRRDTSE
jgi:hypothetical protein